MPSQEDYLDSLLKNLEKNPMDEDSTEQTDGLADELADDDALLENVWSGLESALDSDGNIDLELLGLDPEKDNPEGSDSMSSDEETLSDDDLMSMLDGVDDDDLRDIHKMLERTDNNGAGDESTLRQGSGDQRETNEPEEQKPLSKREQRAQQRKLRKQKKAEAKAAAKAEKMAAKEAAKAAKKKGSSSVEENPEASAGAAQKKPVLADPLFDTSLLDSIVADASQARNEGKSLGGDEKPSVEQEQDENDLDTLKSDMDSLFEDKGNDDSSGGDSNFPEIVALDAEELDNLLPEHEKPEQAKKGFFAKIFDFLTEEDEDEENEGLQLSDENRDILNDLDKEKAGSKKKEKKKKGDGGKAKAKGDKAKKPPKPKKEKPKKEKPKKEKTPDPEPLIPERKLTLKAVLPVVLACVSFGVFIIVFVNASVDFTYRQAASDAYDAGDYETCFQFFYGKDLNETEEAMFEKSRSILHIRLWLREYEMFADEGSEVEALDSLLQTVKDYPKLYGHAVQWNADAEVAAGYQTILNILLEKYGLTEERAMEIAAVRNDRVYTRMVVEIIYGNASGSWDEPATTPEPEPEPEQAPLQDILPEEEGLVDGGFIDN